MLVQRRQKCRWKLPRAENENVQNSDSERPPGPPVGWNRGLKCDYVLNIYRQKPDSLQDSVTNARSKKKMW